MTRKNRYFLIIAFLVAFFGCTPGSIKQAKNLVHENKINDAIDLLNSTIKEDSTDTEALLILAECYVLKEDFKNAQKAFDKSKMDIKYYSKNITNEMISFVKLILDRGEYEKFIKANNLILDQLTYLVHGHSGQDLLDEILSTSGFRVFEDSLLQYNSRSISRIISLFNDGMVKEATNNLSYVIKINNIYKFDDRDDKERLIDGVLSDKECNDALYLKAVVLINTAGMESEIIDIIRENINCKSEPVDGNYLANFSDGAWESFLETWVVPVNYNPEINKQLFGMESFAPRISNAVNQFDRAYIQYANVNNLISFINGNGFSFGNTSTNLKHKWFPAYSQYFKSLQGYDKFAISEKKDSIISQINNMLDSYTLPRLKYHTTPFEVSGKYFIFEDEYDFINEILTIHAFIGITDKSDNIQSLRKKIKWENGAPVALIKVPMTLSEAKTIFTSNYLEGEIKYTVFINKDFRSFKNYSSRHLLIQNLSLIDEPILSIPLGDNSSEIKTVGLNKALWPSHSETNRWSCSKKFNDRKIDGTIIKHLP